MNEPRVVVSALIERLCNGQKQVFVQTRNKPKTSKNYTDMLEIPAGGVDPYENVFDAIKREVYEETGLEVVNFIQCEIPSVKENRSGDKSIAFRPYLCQQVLETNDGLPWYGFVFRCEVKGSPLMNDKEAKDPRWLSLSELSDFLKTYPEKVFSLQYATLLKYLEEEMI
jgi:8-oxo-dGTP pyrophosphatase MutT (NUDIX family)